MEENTQPDSLVPDDDGKEKFKTSRQVAFYRRQLDGPGLQHQALLDSLVLSGGGGASLQLLQVQTQARLLLSLSPAPGGVVRLTIDELRPLKPRFRVPDVVREEPLGERMRVDSRTDDCLTLGWSSGRHQVRVQRSPFRLDFLCEQEVTASLNPGGRLWLEALRRRPSELEDEDAASLWTETFRHFQDVKANGPSSIGVDLRLPGFSHVYGIPLHSEQLLLRDTSDGEPYRLWNLDVFAYEPFGRLGLYGSVPLLVAHRPDRTLGFFWLNASETFVNVKYSSSAAQDDGVPALKRRRVPPHTDVHWLSESGVLDCWVLPGPGPQQVFRQYAELTGFPALPPLFALGYHQSRWNYEDEADARDVDAGFDRHRIPYDVLWLDIEHTDGKRYFTWDPARFPDPAALQRHLDRKQRKLVVISDPHVKLDPDWSLYREARDGGHLVKDREGGVYRGSCWPGESSYLDFSSRATRAWYSGLFSLSRYQGSTPSLFVWNDMNEPSVFHGPEQTMPKDAVHDGGWEHRELHNLYGFYQHMATADGLLSRSGGRQRPFVLSRSFFAGSQRFGAVWTGDNVASWEHLRISVPMLLSLSLAGIAFCGADVGGFVGDPEPELLVRWYQAAALQPFFRGHSSKDTKRREPWLFGENVTAAVRTAIQERYRLLPYWYTLFYQNHTAGLPPLRPLWVEFPEDPLTFSVDHQFLIGAALLARPVTEPGVGAVSVLLPGSAEVWYDVRSAQAYSGGQTVTLPVTMDTVPLFQRGGSVVCRRTRPGSCTAELQDVPLAVTVALDAQEAAHGLLFLDDGLSFAYRDRKCFCLRRLDLRSGRLLCRAAGAEGTAETQTPVQTVSVLGVKSRPASVTVCEPGAEPSAVAFQFCRSSCTLTLTELQLRVEADWDIHITASPCH